MTISGWGKHGRLKQGFGLLDRNRRLPLRMINGFATHLSGQKTLRDFCVCCGGTLFLTSTFILRETEGYVRP